MLTLTPHQQRGSVLLEGLIAVLIFSFGILAIVGLQAASTKAVTQAKSRVDAAFVANQRIGELWGDRDNLGAYAESKKEIDALPNGKRTTEINGTTVTVTVEWKMPGDPSSNTYSTVAQIVGNPPI